MTYMNATRTGSTPALTGSMRAIANQTAANQNRASKGLGIAGNTVGLASGIFGMAKGFGNIGGTTGSILGGIGAGLGLLGTALSGIGGIRNAHMKSKQDKKIAQTKDLVAKKQTEVDAVTARLTTLEASLATEKGKLPALTKAVADADKDLQKAKADKKDAAEIRTKTDALRQATLAESNQKKAIAALEAQVAAVKVELGKVMKEMQDLQNQLMEVDPQAAADKLVKVITSTDPKDADEKKQAIEFLEKVLGIPEAEAFVTTDPEAALEVIKSKMNKNENYLNSKH
jgi:uncharacterized coiled-coil protein SlyX